MGPLGALLLALAVAPPAGAPGERLLAVVPFENVSRRAAAREVVMAAVEGELVGKGYDLVPDAAVEDFLRSRRIRFLDSLAATSVRELASLHLADAVVTGSILAWEPRAPDPAATVAVRLVSAEGEILWSRMVSLSASASGGAFDRGRLRTVEEVARRAVAQALAPMPAPGPLSAVRRPPETFASAPQVFHTRALMGQHLRICVLPLQNLTQSRDAPRVLDAVVQQRLSERPDVTAVQPGDLRAALVKGKLRAPSVLSVEQLGQLSRAVGARFFLRGAILAYGGPDQSGAAAPVELYLSLVDARSGRILWSGLHRRSGADYEGLLRFGAIRDDATLASRVVAELLDAFTRRGGTVESP